MKKYLGPLSTPSATSQFLSIETDGTLSKGAPSGSTTNSLMYYNGTAWVVSSNFTWTESLQKLQVGTTSFGSTTNPSYISMGQTYSSVAGRNPKIRLFDQGDPVITYGLGVSNGLFEFMIPSGASYRWYKSGTAIATMNDSGRLTLGATNHFQNLDIASVDQTTACNIAVRSADVERMRIGYNYNAISGLSNTAQISVDGDGSLSILPRQNTLSSIRFFAFQAGVNQLVEKFRIDQNGRVGVNTTTPRETMSINGSISLRYDQITAATTLNSSHYAIKSFGASSYNITLPDPTTCLGRIYVIKNVEAAKTISQYLDFSNNFSTTLPANTTCTFMSNGTFWDRMT